MKYIFVFFCGLFISCRNGDTVAEGKLSIVDSIMLPYKPNEHFSMNVVSGKDGRDSLLLLHNKVRGRVFLFDWSKKSIVDSIDLNEYTHERDVDVFSNSQGVLYILESSTMTLKSVDRTKGFQREYKYLRDKPSIALLTPLLMPLNVFGDSIFYALRLEALPLTSPEGRKQFYGVKPMGRFRLKDSSLKCVSIGCEFPDKFKSGNYENFGVAAIPTSPDNLYYCFNDLSCFRQSVGGKVESVQIGLDDQELKEVSFDSLGSLAYSKAYSIQNPSVSRLSYDKANDRLLIFFKPSAPLLSPEAELNEYIDCDNYIVTVSLSKEAPGFKYLIPKRLEFRQSVCFNGYAICQNQKTGSALILYKLKLDPNE